MIYADNAATTKLDKEAFEAMKPYLLNEYGNASQPYSFGRVSKKALRQAREVVASCINAMPEEIYFTSGGTESDNWAIKGVALAQKGAAPIITSEIEHHAILRSCEAMEQLGFPVLHVSVNTLGEIELGDIKEKLEVHPRIVSIMFANNEIGTIQPIEELSTMIHDAGALFHTDAVQAVGHIPVNVQKLRIDLLSASAHKFNGPKGIGFLYIRNGTPIIPYVNGGSQEFSIRAGTENVAAIVGMATALRNNCMQQTKAIKHLRCLENELTKALAVAGIDFIRNGTDNRIPGNLSLSFKGISGEMLLHRLDLKGICVSTGSACDGQNKQVSHVLKAIKVPTEYAHGTIRISLGKENTLDEVEKIVEVLAGIICN